MTGAEHRESLSGVAVFGASTVKLPPDKRLGCRLDSPVPGFPLDGRKGDDGPLMGSDANGSGSSTPLTGSHFAEACGNEHHHSRAATCAGFTRPG